MKDSPQSIIIHNELVSSIDSKLEWYADTYGYQKECFHIYI